MCVGVKLPLLRHCFYSYSAPVQERTTGYHFPQWVLMAQITEAFSAYGW